MPQNNESADTTEERFRLLVEEVTDYAMILMDSQGDVASWNPGAAQIFGYSRDEILGRSAAILFTAEDRAAGVPEQELERATAQERSPDIRWHQRQDGSRFWADGVMMALRDESGGLRGFGKVLRDATDRKRAEDSADERIRLLALTADVGAALTTRQTLGTMLHGCAEALVKHLDAAFARIWVLNETDNVLVLKASAGQYTHLDGPHGRVAVGQFKIGLIAQECRPHLTNSVIGDPRVSDQEWARREGMVAFAGYPLVVDGRVIGVAAMFSRRMISGVALDALGAVADEIALGIEGRRTEEALRASEERYRVAFANAAVGVTLADPAGRFLQVNPAYCAITGYSETELLASDFPSLTHADDLPANRSLMERMLAGGMPSFVIEKRYLRKDGQTVWVQNSVSVVRDAQGNPLHTVALTEDITERKQAAEAVREADRRTARILESITDAFFALDSEWRFTYLNDEAERLLFRAREGLLGRNVWEEFPAAVGSAFEREYRRALDKQTAVSFEEFYPPLGTWFEVRAYPSADGLSVYFHDIGDRKAAEAARDRAEAALRESEARFRLMADAIPHIAWTTGPDGSVDYYNQRWYDYSGLTFEETRDWGWEAVIHPEDLAHAGGVWTAAVRAGAVSEVEYRLRRSDGEYRWHLSRSEPVRDEAGRVLQWVGTATDISERKAAEEAQAALLQHEHTIATQLQAALQPDLPGAVPGLALMKHYEAALAEAGVGGDFYDVFALEKGRTALVVGDLSGKGLAAAAQVATVRNMLRAFLYSKPTLAEAVTDLNRVLAENDLLTGFATLFVGAYDGGSRTLTYVNGGQEPALRRRASGQVEQLLPTGPVVGAMEGARFSEAVVKLDPGDALAIFSDGLTECGPRRTAMLGIEGVEALLAHPQTETQAQTADEVAKSLTRRLIAGVDSYAQGGARDDVVLLLGVVS